jgi:glycerol uptake operon antiterminator
MAKSVSKRVERLFTKPVIPVIWDVGSDRELISVASTVILQGGPIADLGRALERFEHPPLDHLRLLVHIDLVSGLQPNEAGLELLAGMGKIDGIVTVHHHIAKTAKSLGFLTVIRMFLSDSRALERGLQIASKCQSDVIEFLPAVAAVKVFDVLKSFPVPIIAGGLCRTEADIRETLDSGPVAVTSTRPELWRINKDWRRRVEA